MSADNMATETPPSHKPKKSRASSEKKSSKKRRHEEQSQSQDGPSAAVAEDITSPSKPSKKRRKSDKAPSSEAALTTTTTTPAQSLQETHTPFLRTTTSFLLPLAPQAYAYPIQGLSAEHLSPLLLTYYAPLDGILLSYANPRLSSRPDGQESQSDNVLALIRDEYATPFLWLTADFDILRPTKGKYMAGTVRVQNPSWLGLVCWNYFNAGIPRRRLPASWKWVEGGAEGGDGEGDEEREDEAEGYWVDGDGKKVQGTVEFRLRDFESAPTTERERGFVSFEGTLLSEEEDKKIDVELRELEKGRSKDKGKRRAARTED